MTTREDRAKAISNYNRAQDLLYSPRTSEQDHELLETALTSRRYWRLAGSEEEFAISDWLVSHVYALLNEPRLSVEFALGAIAHNQDGFPQWLKASLNEGVARAFKCAGDTSKFDHYKSLAIQELALEPDQEDVQFIAEQIASL
jgi:hypothetical protein